MLRENVDRMAFHDEEGTEAHDDNGTVKRIPSGQNRGWGDVRHTRFFGVPSERGIAAAYWAKSDPPPPDMDPDRDGCGLLWCTAVAPFAGKHVRAAVDIMSAAMARHGVDPLLSITGISERAAYCIAAIAYDREVVGEDERALACHDNMSHRLTEAGYYPYRLGINSMGALPVAEDASDDLLRALKAMLDPDDILAPGRYIPVQEPERSFASHLPSSTGGRP
jgi:4-cresol dehydrogenase (hydroxylating)